VRESCRIDAAQPADRLTSASSRGVPGRGYRPCEVNTSVAAYELLRMPRPHLPVDSRRHLVALLQCRNPVYCSYRANAVALDLAQRLQAQCDGPEVAVPW